MIHAISQLKKIDESLLVSLKQELDNTRINWFESYSDYQSGGWYIASLYNSTGEETYDVPEESAIKPTPLLDRMPEMQAFLDSTGLDYMMARLAKASPDSYLYEHRDYEGLDKYKKLRLHIPLQTHPDAIMCIEGINIYLESGYLYKLDPQSAVHGVCNKGDTPRIHLILDCYMNTVLESLVERQWFNQKLASQLPEMPVDTYNTIMKQARLMLKRGQAESAEHLLLSTFFEYSHHQGNSSYEMIIRLYEEAGYDADRINYWQNRSDEVYGNRVRY